MMSATAAPRALRRSGRRITGSGVLLFDLLGASRRLYPEGAGLRDTSGRARSLSWAAENLCALHGVQVRVAGTVPRGPVVLASNHMSYMDPLVICSVLPCAAVAKKEVGGWPLIGETLRTFGVMMVHRDDAHSGARVLRRALRVLAAGTPVLVFPEGTTSTGNDVLPLRRGMFGIARRAGVPVVPVALRYDWPEMAWVGDQSFVPHYVRATARPGVVADVLFGEPLEGRRFASASDLARETRMELRRLLHSQSR